MATSIVAKTKRNITTNIHSSCGGITIKHAICNYEYKCNVGCKYKRSFVYKYNYKPTEFKDTIGVAFCNHRSNGKHNSNGITSTPIANVILVIAFQLQSHFTNTKIQGPTRLEFWKRGSNSKSDCCNPLRSPSRCSAASPKTFDFLNFAQLSL